MSDNTKGDKGRAYHTKCTGAALNTVTRQIKDEDITLFGSCFCPFVQRVWVAFEFLGVPYKVCSFTFSKSHISLKVALLSSTVSYCIPHGEDFLTLISLFLFSARSADEVDPYKKPKELLEVSPRGLVPGLRLNNFNPPRSLNESTVIMEYLEEYVHSLEPCYEMAFMIVTIVWPPGRVGGPSFPPPLTPVRPFLQ